MTENLEFTYDISRAILVEENSGYILAAEYVMMENDDAIIERIRENTGYEVDDFFVEVLRDTIETAQEQYFPW